MNNFMLRRLRQMPPVSAKVILLGITVCAVEMNREIYTRVEGPSGTLHFIGDRDVYAAVQQYQRETRLTSVE